MRSTGGRSSAPDASRSETPRPGSGVHPDSITEPTRPLDERLVRLVVAAVGTAFERARNTSPAVDPSRGLLARLNAAADGSARYGWGFTLALLSFDQGDDNAAEHVVAQLRVSDTVIETGVRELGILLPAAAGDELPGDPRARGSGWSDSDLLLRLGRVPG